VRVAVMSDIHGFSIAFETVLADLEQQGPFDEVIVAGDLCEVGPGPAEVLENLRERDFTVLQGNTDADLVEAATSFPKGSDQFAIKQIGQEGVDYLASLGFSRRITPPGGESPTHDLLAFHANPHNLNDPLHPDSSDHELLSVLGGERAAVKAFGHVHINYVRRVGDLVLADVSAVGNPKDRDLRCKYGVFTWDGEGKTWSVEMRKLPYPLEETEAQILASDLPKPQKTLRKLIEASY
jgi:Calcineurin-like phosphoesterase superfamily domain